MYPAAQQQAAGGGGDAMGGQQQGMMRRAGPAEAVNPEPKLFIGQLLPTVTREDVINRFSMYGGIKNCTLMVNHETGKSKGCAMVTFERFSHAEAAMEAEDGTFHLSGDRKLVVKFADPARKEDGRIVGITPKKLFVGQVPMNMTDDALRAVFGQYGNVVDLHVMRKTAGANNAYAAFVTYDTWAGAEAAIDELHGKVTLPGAGQVMAVRFADGKVVGGGMGGGMSGGMMGGKRSAMDAGMGMGMSGMKRPYGMMGAGMGMPGMMGMMGMPGMMGMGGNMMGMGGNMMGMGGNMMGGGMMGNGMMGGGMGGMMGGAGNMMGGDGGMQAGMMGQGQQAAAGQGMGMGGQQQQMQQQQQQGYGMGTGYGADGSATAAAGYEGSGGDGSGMQAGMQGGMQGMGAMGGMGGGMGGMGGMMPGMMGMMPGMMGSGMMGGMMPGMMGMAMGATGAKANRAQLDAAKPWKIFLGQISYDLEEYDLRPHFAQFGTILELTLLRKPDGSSKGFGFLSFSSREEAEAAIAATNNTVLPNDPRGRHIICKFAA